MGLPWYNKKKRHKGISMTNQMLFDLCRFDGATVSLAALYCGQPDITKLKAWLESSDFNALPSELTCMAANAAAADLDGAPPALAPRLRGLLKYIHALNAGMTAGLLSLAAALSKEGIRLLLLEDTALALCAPEGGRRQLWQLRIGVSKADYARAVDIAHANGWVGDASPWAATMKLDVSRQLTLFPFAESSYVWQNAAQMKLGNTELLCPEPAALLMGMCQLGFRALTKQNPRKAMVQWLMDMKLLLGLFDEGHLDRAVALAKQEKACCHVGLLLHLYAALSGCELPAERFCSQKEAAATARLLEAFRACPETGKKLKRLSLLYRLRRPDSRMAAYGLLAKEVAKKLIVRS